jgi:hypothetical protein
VGLIAYITRAFTYCRSVVTYEGINLKLVAWWFLLSVWINVPVALTKNYQGWVVGGSKAYLYSALSNFIASICIGLVLVVILEKIKFKKIPVALLIVFLSCIYVAHSLQSYNVYLSQRYSYERWKFVDNLAVKSYFSPGKCYIAPWLFDLNGIVMIRTDDYWDVYLSKNWGIKAKILKMENSDCFASEFLDDPRRKPY